MLVPICWLLLVCAIGSLGLQVVLMRDVIRDESWCFLPRACARVGFCCFHRLLQARGRALL